MEKRIMICAKKKCPIHYENGNKGYLEYCSHSRKHEHQMHCDSEYVGCSACVPCMKKSIEKELVR